MSSTTYHTSEFQKIHDGPKATCEKCKKRKLPRSVKSKTTGSNGGKLSSSRRRSRPPRLCDGCDKPIHRNGKTGLCLRCLKAKRKKEARVVKKKKKKVKQCAACSKSLSRNNRSGLCQACWSKSPETQANRQNMQNWVNAAVFHRNATTPTPGSTDAR